MTCEKPAFAEINHHYMATFVGIGSTLSTHGDHTIGSLHSLGTVRLMFDLKMTRRFLWGLDLDMSRINERQDQVIPRRLDTEGLGLVMAYRKQFFSFWTKTGAGRMTASMAKDPKDPQRFAFYMVGLGINWNIYARDYVWIEGVSSVGWLQSGAKWNQNLSPKDMLQITFAISIKLFDL